MTRRGLVGKTEVRRGRHAQLHRRANRVAPRFSCEVEHVGRREVKSRVSLPNGERARDDLKPNIIRCV